MRKSRSSYCSPKRYGKTRLGSSTFLGSDLDLISGDLGLEGLGGSLDLEANAEETPTSDPEVTTILDDRARDLA